MKFDIPQSRKWTVVLSIVLMIAALVFIYFHEPKADDFLPSCLFLELTHWYCPGCGVTRATHAFLHGRIFTAFDYNPLVVMLSPFIIWDLVVFFHNMLSPIKWKSIMGDRVPAWILIVLVISYWILRNIPMAPFTFLAP